MRETDLIIDSGEANLGGSPRVASQLPSTLSVALSINGDPVKAEVDTRLTLLDFLRERARLTGTRKGATAASAARARSWLMAGA